MKKAVDIFLMGMIIFSLIGIFFLYTGGFTGNAISGISNDSYINLTQKIELSENLTKNQNILKIESITLNQKIMNISYSFDNTDFIGEGASVDIWILNENNTEIKRVQDYFPINYNGLIRKDVLIDLENQADGKYFMRFALTSNLNNFVEQSFILENPWAAITGKTILDESKNKFIGYIVFLIIIGIGVFLIFWNRNKKEDKDL
jgi:hypothetical protein